MARTLATVMNEDIYQLVEDLAKPVFTYRMARGMIESMRNRVHPLRPQDETRLRNAEKSLATAEHEIGVIVREWAASHGYTVKIND